MREFSGGIEGNTGNVLNAVGMSGMREELIGEEEGR